MKIDFAKADYGKEEFDAVNKALESQWLASGSENTKFEKEFAEYVGTKHAICVNSGSSANMLALASLGLPKGAVVVTSACGFPATLAPILHLGLDPVLVDYSLESHNIDVGQVLEAIPHVDALIFAHTMGNPVEMELILAKCHKHKIPVIEDCCEAVGSSYNNRKVGSFGTLGTFSFYPAHQITAGGGGGMVVTNDEELACRCKELRDWGKTWKWDDVLGDNQTMYDMDVDGQKYYRHYVYSQVGYNFKLPEICAAFGREQLKKIEGFKKKRMENYIRLFHGFSRMQDFILPIPSGFSSPNWFGFIITIKDGSPVKRNDLGNFLESRGIRHRPFFAGNITRHTPFHPPESFPVADKLMKDSMFIGCHTFMTKEDCDYVIEEVRSYVERVHTEL